MVTVGFIVEGDCEKFVVESEKFRDCLSECNLQIACPVINVGGNGQLHFSLIGMHVNLLKKQANPDKVVVLADLDPDDHVQCITARKKIIGRAGIDLVVIARKALESWFLADTKAMHKWTGDSTFKETSPEMTQEMPWDRLKEIGRKTGLGPGSNKKTFAKKFIRNHGFDVRFAAIHPHCPSAKYFVEKVCALGETAASR